MEMLEPKDAFEQEPNLARTIIKALSLPTTKVTYPWEVAFRQLECAINNGAQFRKNSRVTAIKKIANYFELTINDSEIILTKSVISASGIFSDQIARLLEKNVEYDIKPRRGEYFVLDRKVKGFINHVIYPLPTEKGKGVLIVPQVHGNILLGPTSTQQNEKDLLSNTKLGMDQIREDTKKLAINIPFDQIIRSFAGIRASSTYDDFYIKESSEFTNFFRVAGIDSPGLTAAPAIAKYLVDEVIHHQLKRKTNFNPIVIKPHAFHTLDEQEKQRLYKEFPTHGNLVCKCEKITEKEIIDAIHGPLGSDTVKGIKKRARAGSGLCQGGYCESLVLKIIARETSQPLHKINYYGLNTPILLEETKVKK
jgi:glycerol-3-phosphate dehydrogenase